MSDIYAVDNVKDVLKKKIVIYGASGSGKKFLKVLNKCGFDAAYFSDTNEKKWGTIFEGRKVISPEGLKEYVAKNDCVIIISSVYLKEIYGSLVELGVPESIIVSEFAVKLGLHRYAATAPEMKDSAMAEAFRLRDEIYKKTGDASYHFSIYFSRQHMIDFLKPDQECVLAYQPAKVGSTTIYNSLLKAGYYTVHFHNLAKSVERNGISDDEWKKILEAKVRLSGKIKIITGVRKPVPRDLSHYFQALQAHEYMMYDNDISLLENIDKWMQFCISSESVPCFPDAYRYWDENIKDGIEFDWYTNELKRFFGIDVFTKEFDKSKGYQTYENEYAKVFVYQLERLWGLEDDLREFLQNPSFKIESANNSAEKKYWKLYKECKEKYKAKEQYKDFYYKDNEKYRYFYD